LLVHPTLSDHSVQWAIEVVRSVMLNASH
jgi:hypothetical protein